MTLWKHVERMIRWFRIALTVVTVIAMTFLLLEAVRLYQTLAAVHPLLGVASILAMGVGLALVFLPAWRFLRMPRVVEPPALPPGGPVSVRDLSLEMRYLDRYLANCSRNPVFAPELPAIQTARSDLATLILESKNTPDAAVRTLASKLNQWSTASMDPVLKRVDDLADRLIYQEALAVGLATAASPNGVLDAFVMLWRSVRLVSELGILYYGRPGIFGTLAICRDVSMAVAVAGYMQNLSESLGGVVARTIGGIGGVVAGPAVDGITNGLVLIRIGYLAKQRCRSYRRWDTATRVSAVVSAVRMTQKVAFGLSAEILRQVGWGVTAITGQVVSKVGGLSSSAMEKGRSVAEKMAHCTEDAMEAATRAATSAVRTVADLIKASGTQPPGGP